MTIVRINVPTHTPDDPLTDGNDGASFDEAAERLAILAQLREAKAELRRITDRVFASFAVDQYDRVHEHLSDAMKSIDSAAGAVVKERT